MLKAPDSEQPEVNRAPWRRRTSRESNEGMGCIHRARILSLLVTSPGLLTSDIGKILDLPWSACANALRALETVGLICRLTRREGLQSRYLRWCIAGHWYMFSDEKPHRPIRAKKGSRMSSKDLVGGVDGGFTTDDAAAVSLAGGRTRARR